MSVYHITYTSGLSEVCLYFDGGCQFSCHGCITSWHPKDCHLEENVTAVKYQSINTDKVITYVNPLLFKRVIFLGKEPTQDPDFLPLVKILKRKFSTYNILITNGWEYIDDKALDEVCVSIKAITQKVFKDFTNKDNPEQVLENFKKYKNSSHIRLGAESVFIPGYIDIDEIKKIAKFIAEVDPNIPYHIDGYIPFENDKFRRPTVNEMEEAKKISQRYLKNVSILHFGVKVKYKVQRIY